MTARESMGKHEIADRLRFAPNNLPKGLVEEFVAKFSSKNIQPLPIVFCFETNCHSLFTAMLEMNEAAVGETMGDPHQSRLVINSKIDLREQAVAVCF
jgi:hypothetical protein